MDALREQYEGGFKMSAYKDKTQGTWYVSFRYIDWTGKKTQKLKRGFKTKKEALNYEKEFIRKTAADMKMEMNPKPPRPTCATPPPAFRAIPVRQSAYAR